MVAVGLSDDACVTPSDGRRRASASIGGRRSVSSRSGRRRRQRDRSRRPSPDAAAGRGACSPGASPWCRSARSTSSLSSCMTASCTSRVELSPTSPKATRPSLANTASSWSATALRRAGQVAVRPRPVDVVQHRQQLGEHPADGQLAGRQPLALGPLAVVGVLGLQPLQVARCAPRARPRLDLGATPGCGGATDVGSIRRRVGDPDGGPHP